MTSILGTERLVLREMVPADLDFVATMLADPEVMRFYPKTYSRAEAQEWLDRQRTRYMRDGHALWLASSRLTGEPIGQIGVVRQTVKGVDHAEVGYLLARAFWGQGLATEAACACRDHALHILGRPHVISLIRPENVPSCRVAERMGMRVVDRTPHWGFDHLVYAISREEIGAAEGGAAGPERPPASNRGAGFTPAPRTPAHFLEAAQAELSRLRRQGERALAQVTADDDLEAVLDGESNSLGVLVRHLAGNMRSRWTDFLTSDGEKPDRDREGEFDRSQRMDRAELMAAWNQGWDRVFQALAALGPADVDARVRIRDEELSVLEAVLRQLAHYAGHVGQIVFLAKHLETRAERPFPSLSIPRGQSRSRWPYKGRP